MAQGKGIWLNPETGVWKEVHRHEYALKKPAIAKELGLRDQYLKLLDDLNTNQTNEIRLVGVKGGLVRMRDYGNEIVAQFMAPREKVRNVLWSIYLTMQEIPEYKHAWQVRFHNMKLDDQVVLSMDEFEKRLTNDETILREEKVESRDNISDIPVDHDMINKIDEFLSRNGQ